MTKIEITDFTDEQALRTYVMARDMPRATMAYGVYPNCVKALAEYDALMARFQTDLADFTEYHADVVKAVAPYIDQLQQAMGTIVAIMQAIEAAAPGTFGIELPQEGK